MDPKVKERPHADEVVGDCTAPSRPYGCLLLQDLVKGGERRQ